MPLIKRLSFLFLFFGALPVFPSCSLVPDTIYVRFKLEQPAEGVYFIVIGGYIHQPPWRLPKVDFPENARNQRDQRIPVGEFTPWFNLTEFAKGNLHGPMNRSGGVAELPNITVEFLAPSSKAKKKVLIELADTPDEDRVIKTMEEVFVGSKTSFLVSPYLERDKDKLETAGEMTDRRLQWAKEVSGGKFYTPEKLIVQTSFWDPQRKELNLKEAEVLRLLGFNTVGNQPVEVKRQYDFQVPGHSHEVRVDPGLRKSHVKSITKTISTQQKDEFGNGVPFGFSDEMVCRPPIDNNQLALGNFYQWLSEEEITPEELGVNTLEEIIPIETPEQLEQRQKEDGEAFANRVFYFTSRFRQEKANDLLRQFTESFHEQLGEEIRTTTLVADHPYFSGTGLGMGMHPNPAWGGYPLALDWFGLSRRKSVDLIGIEDWLGLQYMYGPKYTWEGFQLIGFQAAIFRSAGNGELPIITWITPSDETNLRLKAASALCQGAKQFYFWTYGPTATSTENYWSDLRGMYEGIYSVTSQLARTEHIIAEGKTRKTKLALLYSISSDLWQPYGYIHMLERRATYLSLVHDQYLVDLISEEDIEQGKLDDYEVLYVTDPCIKSNAAKAIRQWVKEGGVIYGSCGAGSRNEFNESVNGLAEVFGIAPQIAVEVIPANYRKRGGLNHTAYVDYVQSGAINFGVLGAKVLFQPERGKVIGAFSDGQPAVVENTYGKGRALYVGACPGISYIKDAAFAPEALEEKWPVEQRAFINKLAHNVSSLVDLSVPVVEAGIYDSPQGSVLILGNFTYQPISDLEVKVSLPQKPVKVTSLEKGSLEYVTKKTGNPAFPYLIQTHTPLHLNDMIMFE